MELDLDEFDRNERATSHGRRLPRERGARAEASSYAYRPGRPPVLWILDREFGFATHVARLAESSGLAVSVFWTVGEVLAAPPWHCDALIVDKASWLGLQTIGSRGLLARLKDAVVEIVGDSERERSGPGPQAALDAVLAQIGSTAGTNDPAGGGPREGSAESSPWSPNPRH